MSEYDPNNNPNVFISFFRYKHASIDGESNKHEKRPKERRKVEEAECKRKLVMHFFGFEFNVVVFLFLVFFSCFKLRF